MENFFYNDNFFSDIDTLMCYLDLDDEQSIIALENDWYIQVGLTTPRPIIQYNSYMLTGLVQDDDLSEDQEELETLRKILEKEINFDKINKLVPELCYLNGKTEMITKEYLLEYIK